MLPIPPHFNPLIVDQVWPVPYQQIAQSALEWQKTYEIKLSSQDYQKVCLLLIDVQNTFCLPNFELFVGGESGRGAIDDNVRLCEFIYGNLNKITQIVATLDSHTAMQIFHPIFWVNSNGEHPEPAATIISVDDILNGVWRVNPAMLSLFNKSYQEFYDYVLYYVEKLTESGKFPLTVWPYHSMIGSVGHALVSSVEEAVFFHSIVRQSQTRFELKGSNPLTENYSVLKPEVVDNREGEAIENVNTSLVNYLLNVDYLIIAGQAKSHCVAWTVRDLLTQINQVDPKLARKVYLLEDCTSAVVVPGVVNYTSIANEAYEEFAKGGMNIIQSTDSLDFLVGA